MFLLPKSEWNVERSTLSVSAPECMLTPKISSCCLESLVGGKNALKFSKAPIKTVMRVLFFKFVTISAPTLVLSNSMYCCILCRFYSRAAVGFLGEKHFFQWGRELFFLPFSFLIRSPFSKSFVTVLGPKVLDLVKNPFDKLMVIPSGHRF